MRFVIFQSTRPAWGETEQLPGADPRHAISIHSPRVGRDDWINPIKNVSTISIHSPRVGRDGPDGGDGARRNHFNPLAPRGARRGRALHRPNPHPISIHSPRVGRDVTLTVIALTEDNFNPLAPRGARRPKNGRRRRRHTISIHSPRVGRDLGRQPVPALGRISIHSPRVGRDAAERAEQSGGRQDFNPLAPRGARPAFAGYNAAGDRFQSTRPAWGETRACLLFFQHTEISIHSPRVGRDVGDMQYQKTFYEFQSTRPAWGETCGLFFGAPAGTHFNPLAPRGARRTRPGPAPPRTTFQSTRPAWGETHGIPATGAELPISIHSPRVGRDDHRARVIAAAQYFNPLAPRGARPAHDLESKRPVAISIHSPRVGRDFRRREGVLWSYYFNPLAPRGARLWHLGGRLSVTGFQSTRPAWGETFYDIANELGMIYFNPLAPRGARRLRAVDGLQAQAISIHSPRVGRDETFTSVETTTGKFQSTRPAWGETGLMALSFRLPPFQSTRPAWGETFLAYNLDIGCGFQSTRPAWGET